MAEIKKVREIKPKIKIIEKGLAGRDENGKKIVNGKINGSVKEVSGGSSDESISTIIGGREHRVREITRNPPTASGEGVRTTATENTPAGSGQERTQFYTMKNTAGETARKYDPGKMQQSFLQSAESQGQFFQQRNALHQRDVTASSSSGGDEQRKYYEMEKKKPEAEDRRRRPWWV